MAAKRDYPDHPAMLRLLWRSHEDPSPRSGLTVGRIVAAAVDLADEEGQAALSMRRVAERLGAGTMSLYTYVPGKEELVLLMVDTVHGELPADEDDTVTWRERLAAIGREYWALYRRHRWLLDVPVSRPILGPNLIDRYEHELRAVDGIGLDDLQMNAVVELVRGHVAATARRALEISRDTARSGISDDEWWYSVVPALTEVLSGRDYPLGHRVGTAVGAPHSDPEYSLEFGLTCILNGIEALVAARRAD